MKQFLLWSLLVGVGIAMGACSCDTPPEKVKTESYPYGSK